METKYILGTLYILYAIVKITVGLSLFILPLNVISNTPVLNLFTKEAADKTFAGRFYEYILLLFGVFTLFNGLALFDLLSPSLIRYFESEHTEYIVFITLGTLLTVFYSLVLYTNLPISKNKAYYDHYKLLGLIGGISFLVMPIIWEIIAFVVPAFRALSREGRAIFVISSIIITVIIGELIYTYFKRSKKHVQDVLPENVQVAVAVKNQIESKIYSPSSK
jgi:uncharacterized membrane protein